MSAGYRPTLLHLDSIQMKPFITLVHKVKQHTGNKTAAARALGVCETTITNLLERQLLTSKQAPRILAGYKKWKQSLPLETP